MEREKRCSQHRTVRWRQAMSHPAINFACNLQRVAAPRNTLDCCATPAVLVDFFLRAPRIFSRFTVVRDAWQAGPARGMHARVRATCISPHSSPSHLLASSCSSGKGGSVVSLHRHAQAQLHCLDKLAASQAMRSNGQTALLSRMASRLRTTDHNVNQMNAAMARRIS
jgi:hypothetical protein